MNISNIENAFQKYAGVVFSEFDSHSVKTQCEELYKKILNTDCYKLFFNDYKKDRKNIQTSINIQKFIAQRFNANHHSKQAMIDDGETYLNYLQKLGLIDNVIGIDDKYKEPNLLYFLKEVINLIKDTLKDNSGNKVKEIVDFWFENLGMIESDLLAIEEMNNGNKIKDSKLKKSKEDDQPYNIIDLIKEMNAKEREKETFIADYIQKLHTVFDKIIEFDKSKNDGRLILKLNNLSTYNDFEISEEFTKVWNITARRLKNDVTINTFIKEIENNISLLEGDFVTYIHSK